MDCSMLACCNYTIHVITSCKFRQRNTKYDPSEEEIATRFQQMCMILYFISVQQDLTDWTNKYREKHYRACWPSLHASSMIQMHVDAPYYVFLIDSELSIYTICLQYVIIEVVSVKLQHCHAPLQLPKELSPDIWLAHFEPSWNGRCRRCQAPSSTQALHHLHHEGLASLSRHHRHNQCHVNLPWPHMPNTTILRHHSVQLGTKHHATPSVASSLNSPDLETLRLQTAGPGWFAMTCIENDGHRIP